MNTAVHCQIADVAFVYFNPHTIEHKKLQAISSEQVQNAFGSENVKVFTDSKILVENLKAISWDETNLLLMTSGNFDGVDFNDLAKELVS